MKTLLAFLLLVSVAWAEKPVPLVQGPTNVNSGALVILDASETQADFWDWDVDVSGVEVPNGPSPLSQFEQSIKALEAIGCKVEVPKTDGEILWAVINEKWLHISSYPGVYRVHLAVSNADGCSQHHFTIVVHKQSDDVDPNPDPDPDPDPTPVPVIGVTKVVRDAVRQSVTPANREMFLRIAAVYDGLSSDISKGLYTTPDVIVSTTRTVTNAATVGYDKKAWEDIVKGPNGNDGVLGLYLSDLKAQGKLVTPEDHARVWKEIAEGLRLGAN